MTEYYKKSPYADNYRARYEEYLRKKREGRQDQHHSTEFSAERFQRMPQRTETLPPKLPEYKFKRLPERTYYHEKPKSFRFLIIPVVLVILAALAIAAYLLVPNFLPGKNFNYFYDIGSSQDASSSYLTPIDRVSEIITDSDTNYRSLIGPLVYFSVPIPEGSNTVKIDFRFFNNLPENQNLKLGARNQEEWNYTFHSLKISSQTGQWQVVHDEFNLQDENLLPMDGKLSLAFYALYLFDNTANHSIPIDWINITVHSH
jgi:hypothetical protein